MPEGYPKEVIKYKIQVTNPYSYDVNASARVENPAIGKLSDNYTFIPDLSWVKFVSETIYIPAGSSRFFELLIDIPDDEKPWHYNESWEAWVVISSDRSGSSGDFLFKIELAVKLFINTPPGEKATMIQNLYIILGIVVALIATSAAIFYVKKNKKSDYNKNKKT